MNLNLLISREMKGMMLCVAATFFFRKPLKAYVTVSPAKVEAPPLRLKCILAPSSHLQQRKRPKVNISTCCSLLQDILNYLDSNGPRSSSTSIIKTENTVQRPSKHHLFLMETEAELDKLTKTMKAFQPTPPPRTVKLSKNHSKTIGFAKICYFTDQSTN